MKSHNECHLDYIFFSTKQTLMITVLKTCFILELNHTHSTSFEAVVVFFFCKLGILGASGQMLLEVFQKCRLKSASDFGSDHSVAILCIFIWKKCYFFIANGKSWKEIPCLFHERGLLRVKMVIVPLQNLTDVQIFILLSKILLKFCIFLIFHSSMQCIAANIIDILTIQDKIF